MLSVNATNFPEELFSIVERGLSRYMKNINLARKDNNEAKRLFEEFLRTKNRAP